MAHALRRNLAASGRSMRLASLSNSVRHDDQWSVVVAGLGSKSFTAHDDIAPNQSPQTRSVSVVVRTYLDVGEPPGRIGEIAAIINADGPAKGQDERPLLNIP